MGFFSKNDETAFVGGARGFAATYDDVRVSYLAPNNYQEGAPMVGMEGQEPPFKARTDEIIAWGALCIAVGETLLRTFDMLSFAPGLESSLEQFRKDAVGIVSWRLRMERRDMPPEDVKAALEKEREHIKVILLDTDHAPKKAFTFKRFGEDEK